MLRLSNQSQIDRLKKLAEEGSASEQDLARLALLIESVGDTSDELRTQTLERVCNLNSFDNIIFNF